MRTRGRLSFSSDPTRAEGNEGPEQRDPDDGIATDREWTIASVGLVGMVHTQFSFNMLADAQFLSCRPRDEDADERIMHHIKAAASRREPIELVPQSFLPPFPRLSLETRHERILRREKKQSVALRLDKEEIQVYHRFGEGIKHQTKRGSALVNDAKGANLQQQLGLGISLCFALPVFDHGDWHTCSPGWRSADPTKLVSHLWTWSRVVGSCQQEQEEEGDLNRIAVNV